MSELSPIEREVLQRKLAAVKASMKEMPGVTSLDIEELSARYDRLNAKRVAIEKQLEEKGGS